MVHTFFLISVMYDSLDEEVALSESRITFLPCENNKLGTVNFLNIWTPKTFVVITLKLNKMAFP